MYEIQDLLNIEVSIACVYSKNTPVSDDGRWNSIVISNYNKIFKNNSWFPFPKRSPVFLILLVITKKTLWVEKSDKITGGPIPDCPDPYSTPLNSARSLTQFLIFSITSIESFWFVALSYWTIQPFFPLLAIVFHFIFICKHGICEYILLRGGRSGILHTFS